jgi:poly(3-hydroxybutyrate) depolymerase
VFYQLLEWQRQWAAPWLDATRLASGPARSLLPLQVAGGDLARRLVGALEPVEADLSDFVRADVVGPFDARAVETSPFATTWRLRAARAERSPAVLVPPFSGYVAGVTSPLVVALLRHRPVVALDWRDARLVPSTAGPFGLVDQIKAVERAIFEAGPGSVAVGLSQSVVATVAGAALAAARGCKVRALVLLAGPLDTREGQHPLSTFLRVQPLQALQAKFTTTVPPRYPGRGRMVYPGLYQLIAYALGNAPLYFSAQAGLLAELAAGHPALRTREHRDLHSLQDVPGELFLDTVAVAFQQHALAQGRLSVDRRRVDLEALRGVELLTIEGTADELVGQGHTHRAVDLLPHGGARRVTVEGARHHEMFTGLRFVESVAPHLEDLLDAA